jgi:hypothetical protein
MHAVNAEHFHLNFSSGSFLGRKALLQKAQVAVILDCRVERMSLAYVSHPRLNFILSSAKRLPYFSVFQASRTDLIFVRPGRCVGGTFHLRFNNLSTYNPEDMESSTRP